MEARLMGADPAYEIDRSLIGSNVEPYVVTVERGAIVKFVTAIGDTNPLFRDPDFARAHGYRDVVAPPTFPVSFLPPEEPVWWRNIDRRRIVAGEQSFRYERPIVAGDRLTCTIVFVDVVEKAGRSGRMEFLIQENRGCDDSGAEVFVHRRTAIYRAPDSDLSAA